MLDGHIIISKFGNCKCFFTLLERLALVHNFGKDVVPLGLDVFVHNVKELCDKRNEKVTVALTNAGLSKNLLNNVSAGSAPSVEKVQQLAQYFGVTTSQLLGEVTVGSKVDAVSLEDMDLIHAFHAADDRTQEIVRLSLKPFGLSALKEKAM